jgi:MoaA/NifB/PqqE/SkfB family radical SAM enzyme
MGRKPDFWTKIDSERHLELPQAAMAFLGLQTGEPAQLIIEDHNICISRSVHDLARVYIEPTNACNLDCVTCMRQVWDEKPGMMNEQTFSRILLGLQAQSNLPTVFFGGYGEPLSHPRIIDMIQQVKTLGAPVELITNGVFLSEKMILRLLEVELDWLWVSLDGASPESYADVRLGAEFPKVIENLTRLRYLRYRGSRLKSTLQLGIAFVAMRRNIADLPQVLALGTKLGAKRFSVTNVLPHTPEMCDEILYRGELYGGPSQLSDALPRVNMPRMDINETTKGPLAEIQRGHYVIQTPGFTPGKALYTCPFVEKGSLSIRWDGQVSPCLPLLHTHDSYIDRRPRRSYSYHIANVNDQDLLEIWNDENYVALRKRLKSFEFSPCTDCNCCELPEENLEDCLGNTFPACSGCLWAQGLIQCP